MIFAPVGASPLILASQSPRRRELLGLITPDFTVQVSDADETLAPGTPPEDGVVELALRKARAVFSLQPQDSPCVVIGADTVVAINGRILGKPHSHEECVEMLRTLSGREHTVHTGVAILAKDRETAFLESTQVEFWPLTDREIAWYASTDEPYDKAGAYGIQGRGSVLVKGIRGDYFAVMGLPVARLWRHLRQWAG